MSVDEINALLRRVTYRPGWTFVAFEDDDENWVLLFAVVPNAYRPDEAVELRIFAPLPPCANEEQFLLWLRWRVKVAEIHELREWLRVDGHPIADPHGGDSPAMRAAAAFARERVRTEGSA